MDNNALVAFLYQIACGLTIGMVAGMVLSVVLLMFSKKRRQRWKQAGRRKAVAVYLLYFALFILVIGLVWTVYFLVLGTAIPAQAEYANNMSQLIVSALTVFSIIIAFYQFMSQNSTSS